MMKIYSKKYYLFVVIYVAITFIIGIFSLNFFDQIRSFTNKSNSMNPIINTGSIVVVRKQNIYKQGDIISYYVQVNGKEEIITHRILRMGGNVYITKGDNNTTFDREVVKHRLVIGRVIWIIPFLGYFITFAKGPIGLIFIIYLPASLIFAIEIYKIYLDLRKKDFYTS